MSGFPINLDLSEYFGDLRKYSSVFVNLSKSHSVGDVECHIKSVFGLEENICLVHKKFLIPKSEDILILQQYDIYKVQKCNFYDLQIHKSKKENSNSVCDQKALNLTQSEKTIDLSCRPKQRLKTSVCPSPSLSGTPSLNNDSKRYTNSQIVSPKNDMLMNGNHNVTKEKPKSKKKRCMQDSESDDDGDILDMSVKNSKRKKHSNCFSTDDGSLLSDCVNEIHRDVTKEHHKKLKKKKKHYDGMDGTFLDIASSCRENLVCNFSSNKDQNSKKKCKKSREDQLNGCSSAHANQKPTRNGQEHANDLESNQSLDDEYSVRKKHKHSKKSCESKYSNDSLRNQYYSSSPLLDSTDVCHNKSSITKSNCNNNKNKSNLEFSNSLEDQKKIMQLKVDRMISDTNQCLTFDTNSKHDGNVKTSNGLNSRESRSDNNIEEDGDDEQTSITENIKSETYTNLDSNNPKKKRKRKHCKKKKKEKLLHMLAVGPMLSQLTTEVGPILSQLTTEPTVAKLTPPSDSSKHVYFTEEDFAEEMDVPTTPTTKSHTDSLHSHNTHKEVEQHQQSQEQSFSNLASWKENQLKLTSSSTKPVVFQRNSSVTTISKQTLSQASLDHSVPVANTPQPDNKSLDAQETTTTDVQRCAAVQGNNENNNSESTCSGTANEGSRKTLPDICKPLPTPNSVQDINLSNYPIIEKVVPEDLILFKVWKFNEHGEAGLSKPILAKVKETTSFPQRISLNIMEGCEECSHCVQPGESDGTFIIELQWSDINEPRLFYP